MVWVVARGGWGVGLGRVGAKGGRVETGERAERGEMLVARGVMVGLEVMGAKGVVQGEMVEVGAGLGAVEEIKRE